MEILKVIEENFLVVRRLPFETETLFNYREGDEERYKKPAFYSNGKPVDYKNVEIFVENLDIEWFKKTPPQEWDKNSTPEKRYERYKHTYPNGRKFVRITKTVDKGGWWYVKQVKNTDSTVRFSREYDKFFAPTLEEAVQLFLNRNSHHE